MNISGRAIPQRRGACPGLSAPMPTGDGLLARLHPLGTITLSAFTALCAAARCHGNGIIEITSRGSIQIRGLTAASAAPFAAEIAALRIAAADGTPILCNALAGIDAAELLDAGALAADLRRTLSQRPITAKLSPKVSVTIDGGGAVNLAGVSADVRLCAQQTNGDITLCVEVGGNAETAVDLGTVALKDGVETAVRLLDVIARHGRESRAREIVAAKDCSEFRAVLADIFLPARLRKGGNPELDSRLRGNERNVIGIHSLRDGSLASGVGLAFGHADAATLEYLAAAAGDNGASGFRAAPGRVLIAIGLEPDTAPAYTAAAAQLGFIVRAADPRRHVVACAGAPICAAAHLAARNIAPAIAAAAAPHLSDAFTIHLSGCAKGCARAGPAALTVVGTPAGCALVADGSARDAPFAIVPASQVSAAIAQFAGERIREAGHV